VFLVIDGQDIYCKQLTFCYLEIAQYISTLIPKKIWSNKSEKLNIYERVMIAAPALVI